MANFVRIRYLISMMVFLALAIDSGTRSAMSMTILAMVNHTNIIPANDTGLQTPTPETFDWDQQIQSYVLNSVYVGFLLSQLPAGHLAESFSLKWVLGYGIFFTSLLTLIGPFVASYNVWLFIATRVLSGVTAGVTFPSGVAIVTRWSPLQERTILISLAFQGYLYGPMISMMISGPICDYLGWRYVFFILGGFGVIWSILWYFVVASSPEKHWWISDHERDFILNNREGNFDRDRKIPWKAIMCSKAVWILNFRCLCGGILVSIGATYMPMFLKDNFDVDLTTTGFVSGVAYVLCSVVAVMSAVVADHLLQSGYTINQVRKTFSTFSMVLPACLFLILTQFEYSFRAVAIMICLTNIVWGFYGGCDNALPVDLAAEYAGAVGALQNVFVNIASICAPLVVGWYLETTEDLNHWNTIFTSGAFISILGGTVFLVFGTAEKQDWSSSISDDLSPLIEPL